MTTNGQMSCWDDRMIKVAILQVCIMNDRQVITYCYVNDGNQKKNLHCLIKCNVKIIKDIIFIVFRRS